MDLLGGYGSSDEEDDQVQKASGSTIAAFTAEPSNQSTTKAIEKPIEQKQKQQQQGKINPKGRKILSLASVLPQHIFDQLTKSQVQGDVSDDEEDDTINAMITTKGAPKIRNAPPKSELQVQKEGISSLLLDLQQAAPTASCSGSSTTPTFSSKPAPPSKPQKQKQERMGAAFLQSTIVVETKTTSNNNTVRDIHAEEEADTNVISVSAAADSHLLKPAPAAAAAAAPTAVARDPQVATAPTFTRVNPVPGMMPRAAAPPIQLSTSSSTAAAAAAGGGGGGAPPSLAYSAPPASEPATMADDRAPPRKRMRKEMERALRQGNLAAALESDANFSASLQQAPPDAYVPEPETYAVPQHGIKVVPTAMYDPSAGQAVQGASDKGRGKNQIHHLMASAASLELQRARGLGGNAGGKAHRANAKQKYGW